MRQQQDAPHPPRKAGLRRPLGSVLSVPPLRCISKFMRSKLLRSFPTARFLALTLPVLSLPWLAFAAPPSVLPPHPTVLLADYKGTPRSVVGVTGTDPRVVADDGQIKRIRTDVSFRAARAANYGEGFIQFKSQQASGMRFVATYDAAGDPNTGGGLIASTGYYEATILPREDHRDCFIALIAYDSAFLSGRSDRPNAQIVLHDLPDLVGGKETKIAFTSPMFSGLSGYYYFSMIFSNGFELRSNLTDAGERYFRQLEIVQHAATVARYRDQFATADHAAAPTLTVAPTWPSGISLPTSATPYTAQLSVTAAGLVDDVQITPELTSEARTELVRALHGWLFLPRLQAGQPLPTRINLPLK